MTLEVFTTGTEEYGHWIKLLLVGYPGAGKTLLSSTFPNTFYASAEGGLMSLADRAVKGTKITETTQLKELINILKLDPVNRSKALKINRPIDTVVIDTIDEVQKILINERKRSEKIEVLRIQDYGYIGDTMEAMIRSLRNLDMHVVFTCHMKDSKDEASGRIIYEPRLVGSTAGFIPGAVDLALRLEARTELKVINRTPQRVTERKLVTYPDASHEWVKDRSGKLPPELVVNFEDDYARMDEYIFGGKVHYDPAADSNIPETQAETDQAKEKVSSNG